MVLAEDAPVAMIDPVDVGSIGAHLLSLEDPSQHKRGMSLADPRT